MGYKYVEENKSFATWFIDEFGVDKFSTLIDHEKNIVNGIDVWHITKRSLAPIAFKCEYKNYHEFSLSADSYYKGNRCKYCGRTKYVHPLDSFGQYIVDNYSEEFLNKIWSIKNTKTPFEYTANSEQKVYFVCYDCGDEMGKSQIKNYVRSRMLCQKCIGNVSTLHRKVIDYLLKNNFNINREHGCTIIPINPITKYPLPFDVEIPDIKLIIEIHGKQHYIEMGESSKWLNGMSSMEYLAKRKKYDEYKKSFAIAKGFYYLEIPYWTEHDNSYIKLINEKIKEINNIQYTNNDCSERAS